MFSILGAIFKEQLEYRSEIPADALRKEMEDLFLRTKGFRFRPNLSGAFGSGDEFVAYPKIEIGSTLAGGRTSISGKIAANNSSSIVSVIIRPNPILRIIFWFSLIFGSVFYVDFLYFSHKQSSRELGFYFAIVAPLFVFGLSLFTKMVLKFSFTSTFRLTRVRNGG